MPGFVFGCALTVDAFSYAESIGSQQYQRDRAEPGCRVACIDTLNYITLTGGSAVTAPVAGAFSPDDKLFFVSTSGDNLIHLIDVPTLQDTEQINPSLPACAPGSDAGCTITTTGSTTVPATAIAVKPRSTT